ncbi:hypothetical protein VTN00DRAFT_2212 [Thermoascus crustaceus]|uniref:uncharacterized protein n=1 Tax=Thermoascus crustaceus TaxID=5088 RepID=UPI003741FCA0
MADNKTPKEKEKDEDTSKEKRLTVPVKIELACVAADLELVHFSFKERFPRDLVEDIVPFCAWKECQDALAHHSTALVQKCEQIAFLARDNWKCHACGKQPTHLYRGVTYGGAVHKRNAQTGRRVLKVMFDAIAIPLCKSNTECEKKAEHLAFVYSSIKSPLSAFSSEGRCWHCLEKIETKICSACKLVAKNKETGKPDEASKEKPSSAPKETEVENELSASLSKTSL